MLYYLDSNAEMSGIEIYPKEQNKIPINMMVTLSRSALLTCAVSMLNKKSGPAY